jgi:hypothetical protein
MDRGTEYGGAKEDDVTGLELGNVEMPCYITRVISLIEIVFGDLAPCHLIPHTLHFRRLI